MLSLLQSIAGLLTPVAHADIWGSSRSQAISDMFARIRAVLLSEADIGGDNVIVWLAGRIVQFTWPLIGAAAVLLILYAGMQMIWGRGNEESFSQAKTIISHALLGVALGSIASVAIGYAVYFFSGVLQ